MDQFVMAGVQSPRLAFRKVRLSDVPLWLPFFQDPASSEHWQADYGPPDAACKNWYERQLQRYAQGEGGMCALIEQNSGSMVGHCGLLVQSVNGQWELEIGYSLLREHWGQGYAIEAAKACRDHAFAQGWAQSLISIISHSNIASQKVALRNGMTVDFEATFQNNRVKIYRVHHSENPNQCS